jgi:pyruvate dehydrogenase E1 component alpha subunit
MSSPTQLEMYELMLTLRRMDEVLCEALYFHSVVGEEAVPVGTFLALEEEDWGAPHNRGAEIVFAMRGQTLTETFAQHIPSRRSWSRGKAPSHCGDPQAQFVPWVTGTIGTHIGIAAGTAHAQKLSGDGNITICSFGDGAVHTSMFHGALNFAAVHQLPIVFVCQNNNFTISLPVERATANTSLFQRAIGYGMPSERVDGNDVEAVYAAVCSARDRARRGLGPTLIEAKTYRMHGHIEVDPARYRPQEEVEAWAAKDPLDHTAAKLKAAGVDLDALDTRITAEVREAYDAAALHRDESSDISEDDLDLDRVYAVKEAI